MDFNTSIIRGLISERSKLNEEYNLHPKKCDQSHFMKLYLDLVC